jgi:hypothetical protein
MLFLDRGRPARSRFMNQEWAGPAVQEDLTHPIAPAAGVISR